MTRDEILAMEAGDETNVLVAQTVMGLDVCTEHDGWPGEWCRKCQRHWAEDYSGEIAPAWKVVEKVCVPGGWLFRLHRSDGVTWALFDKWPKERLAVQAQAEPNCPALAICRAALLAVMELDE